MSATPSTETRSTQVNAAVLGLEARAVTGMASDVGCVRTLNEDAAVIVRDTEGPAATGILAVACDGMGGHAAGEVASRLAIETISKHWNDDSDPTIALPASIRLANRAIVTSAGLDRTKAGMGTTCIALVIRGGLAWCAHVGDSRCYLVRDGSLFLMTEDHSAVMQLVKRGEISATEARVHPDKNVISRALGGRKDVEVTTWPRPFSLRFGDTFLLCTDGLYDLVSDDLLLNIVLAEPPQAACEKLIAAARELGAPDNVTAIVIALPSDGHASTSSSSNVRETRVGESSLPQS